MHLAGIEGLARLQGLGPCSLRIRHKGRATLGGNGRSADGLDHEGVRRHTMLLRRCRSECFTSSGSFNDVVDMGRTSKK